MCAEIDDKVKAFLLVGALLLEQNDEWAVRRGPLHEPETIATLGENPLVKLPAVAAA